MQHVRKKAILLFLSFLLIFSQFAGTIVVTAETTDAQTASDAKVIDIAAGNQFTLAVKDDGSVWSWGQNNVGQLGINSVHDQFLPQKIEGLDHVIAVSTGGTVTDQGETKANVGHALALKDDGTVWSWGFNQDGQLGDGTSKNRAVPQQVSGLEDIIAITSGSTHSLALKADGTVWSWGNNTNGQLGDGTTDKRTKPVQVKGLENIAGIFAGVESNSSFAIAEDGKTYAWGSNWGKLGTSSAIGDETEPVEVTAVENVAAVASGANHTLMTTKDGKTFAWGDNYKGRLGNGNTTNQEKLVQLKDVPEFVSVLTNNHTLALTEEGKVWSWGYNAFGMLGDGTEKSSANPSEIKSLAEVIKIAIGNSHSVALTEDGEVFTWGLNTNGQVGLEEAGIINTPQKIEVIQSAAVIDLTLDQAEVVLESGESHQLKVTAHFSNGTSKDVSEQAAYQSSDASIATISDRGLVEAIKEGAVSIYVTYKDKTTGLIVTVEKPIDNVQLAIENAGNKITQLPESIKYSHKAKVEDARKAVTKAIDLGAKEANISNLQKLIDAEAEIKNIDKALKETIEAIASLPKVAEVQLSDREAVEAVRAKVQELFTLGVSATDIHNLSHLAEVENKLNELSGETYELSANAGFDQVIIAGQTIKFDGTLSKEQNQIVRYEWDFGDGSKGEGAAPSHQYNEAGDYSVTLTVFDKKGRSASHSIVVTVEPAEEAATLAVRVLDKETKGALPHATVTIQFPDGTMQNAKADKQGLVQLVAEPGEYTAFAYREGFKPGSAAVKFEKDSKEEYKIELERGEVVLGDVKVERMTREEIIAAGIDVNDPDNQNVYEFEVWLAFSQGAEFKPHKFYGNSKRALGGSFQYGEMTIHPFIIPTNRGGRPSTAYIVIPGKASWLKEFFNVELVVENQADAQFILENAKAALNLPDGLSLAPTAERQSHELNLGDIAGQEAGNASWIIRGDKKGDHHVSIDFEAELMPFKETVKTNFVTKEPFRVWGEDALRMFVYAQEGIRAGSPYNVTFQMLNVSDIPVYNLNLELFLSKGQGFLHQSDTSTFIAELPPGETLEQSVTLFPTICECGGTLNLDGSFVVHTGGNANVQTEILPMSAYTDWSEFRQPSTVDIFEQLSQELFTFMWGAISGAVGYNILPVIEGMISSEPIQTLQADENMASIPLANAAINGQYVIETITKEGKFYLHPVVDLTAHKESTAVANQRLVNEGAEIFTVEDSAAPYQLTMPLEGEKRHNYDVKLNRVKDVVGIDWPGSHQSYFKASENGYKPLNKGAEYETLQKTSDGNYVLTIKDQSQYVFNDEGQLVRQDNGIGQQLAFTYDNEGMLKKIYDNATATSLQLQYNEDGLLTTVIDHRSKTAKITYDDQQQVTSITDKNNYKLSYKYDEEQRIVKVMDHEGTVLQENKYSSDGLLTEVVDANGHVKKFTYVQQNGELHVQVTDEKDQEYKVVRNQKGQIIRTESAQSTVKFTYDGYGNIQTMIDDMGNVVTNTYDEKGNLQSVTDPNGNKTTYSYDERNNLISETDALGNQTTYEYNGSNQLVKVIDAEGNETKYRYNLAGLPSEEILPNGGVRKITYEKGLIGTESDATGIKTSYEYDEWGRLSKVNTGGKGTISYTYDEKGNVQTITDALGNQVSYTYNHRGQVLTETDANGNQTTYEYSAKGELLQQKNALGDVTFYKYDMSGNLIETIDPKGNHTTMTYNATGQLTSLTDPLGNKTSFEYDSLGNHIRTIDAAGNTIETNTYDKIGNLVTTKDALGQETKFEYDPLNQIIKSMDALNRSMTYAYNGKGELINTIDPLDGKSSQSFDGLGNLQSLTDPNENESLFTYDKEGRITGVTLSSGNVLSMSYNGQGLLEKETNARGQEVVYEYDASGRMTVKKTHEGKTTYQYDDNGNITAITDQNGTIQKSYDQLNRLISYTDIYGNIIGYEYDASGNLSVLTYPDRKKVVYQYDGADRLTEVKDWNGRTTTYAYDPNGKLAKTTRSDGSIEHFTYDKAGQLISSKNAAANGTVISEFDYGYDQTGNIVTETNRVQSSLNPIGGSNTAMTYGADNRLSTYNGTDVEFDADGNMTFGPLAGQMDRFVYDSANRLVEAGDTSYVYDAENRRVAVTDNGQTTRFIVDPNHVLTQVLMETDEQGNPISYYVYGHGLISQENTDGSYHLYHYDSRGSTIALTNEKGEVTDEIQYSPYGELLSRTGTTKTSFLFNGQYGVMTDDNGLYYMRARYYQPEIKRFVNQDVLLGNIANSATLNRYAYVNGQPINLIDPFGLCGMEGIFGDLFDWMDKGSDWIEKNKDSIRFVSGGVSLFPPLRGASIVTEGVIFGNSAYRFARGKKTGEELYNDTWDGAFGMFPGMKGSSITKRFMANRVNNKRLYWQATENAKHQLRWQNTRMRNATRSSVIDMRKIDSIRKEQRYYKQLHNNRGNAFNDYLSEEATHDLIWQGYDVYDQLNSFDKALAEQQRNFNS